ncbi:MAG TPA: amidohydrolase family protein [Planctomycetota bacterium]|jgi:imidazolonepropionase-like amidohydrolase|nr:amidohydrolase family protein [Planctomycetota bacterium]OQC20035.1 MAG: hypothetical protein BWX69_02191 [Planctomycetes bacterium ADurb.Bin069]HNR99551.1 amidohydrolase family protein [Planctomycetota bacterium]HNU27448.1 amidohydrolase family protein [Planctomycetota bacterium]HOE28425.1 amidohydrolase family protein [Planctomycetota bacterium]
MRAWIAVVCLGACAAAADRSPPWRALTDLTIVTGTGATIEGGTVLFRGGVIEAAGEGIELPEGTAAASAKGQVLIPGLIAADTLLAAGPGEDERSICAANVACDGFEYFAPFRDQLASGTTCAYLSAGTRRLVPGQGSVVKLGAAPERAVVARRAALEGVLTAAALGPPLRFAPEPYLRPEDPFPLAERQLPNARASQVAELRAFLKGDDESAREARAKERVFRVRADTEREIRAALALAEAQGLSLVIVGGREAGRCAGEIARAGAAVVWRAAFAPGARDLRDLSPDRARLEVFDCAPAALAARNVPVAIVSADFDGAGLLGAAAFAAAHGFPREKALAAVTSEAARILGIAGRTGSIEKGKDADFVLLSALPFSEGASVCATYVDGEEVFARDRRAAAAPGGDLVLRGALVLTGDGGRFPGTDIIVAGDRITAVGPNLPVPDGARVLDLAGKVVIPGLIDLSSRLGTHFAGGAGDQAPPFSGAETFHLSVSAMVRHDDPVFAACAGYGVLGLLLRGGESALFAGTGAFLAPGAGREDFLVRPFGCLDIDVSGSARLARLAALRNALRNFARYEEARRQYREALDEFTHRKPRDAEGRLKEPVPPQKDPISEFLLQARRGELPVFVRAARGDEIEGVLNVLAEDGGFAAVLLDAEGLNRAGEHVATMARGAVLLPPYRRRIEQAWVDLPQLCAEKGIPFALASDGAAGSLYLRFYAAEAVSRGLAPDAALRAVTSVPARLAGLADRMGTIARGRWANLVVLDGEPFAPGSRVETVLVRGKVLEAFKEGGMR